MTVPTLHTPVKNPIITHNQQNLLCQIDIVSLKCIIYKIHGITNVHAVTVVLPKRPITIKKLSCNEIAIKPANNCTKIGAHQYVLLD